MRASEKKRHVPVPVPMLFFPPKVLPRTGIYSALPTIERNIGRWWVVQLEGKEMIIRAGARRSWKRREIEKGRRRHYDILFQSLTFNWRASHSVASEFKIHLFFNQPREAEADFCRLSSQAFTYNPEYEVPLFYHLNPLSFPLFRKSSILSDILYPTIQHRLGGCPPQPIRWHDITGKWKRGLLQEDLAASLWLSLWYNTAPKSPRGSHLPALSQTIKVGFSGWSQLSSPLVGWILNDIRWTIPPRSNWMRDMDWKHGGGGGIMGKGLRLRHHTTELEFPSLVQYAPIAQSKP